MDQNLPSLSFLFLLGQARVRVCDTVYHLTANSDIGTGEGREGFRPSGIQLADGSLACSLDLITGQSTFRDSLHAVI